MRPPGIALLLGTLSAVMVPCLFRGRHTPLHLISVGPDQQQQHEGKVRHARHRVAKETLEARPLEESRDTRTYEHGYPPQMGNIQVSPPGWGDDIYRPSSNKGPQPGYTLYKTMDEHAHGRYVLIM